MSRGRWYKAFSAPIPTSAQSALRPNEDDSPSCAPKQPVADHDGGLSLNDLEESRTEGPTPSSRERTDHYRRETGPYPATQSPVPLPALGQEVASRFRRSGQRPLWEPPCQLLAARRFGTPRVVHRR